ncbi:carboxypeptidase-like regulatory domain-containing protein [Mucilaginibacter antarcticus]|uniref:carboxypeptidase-like regulatory domain-containing protein n=1 Tax=Mucilaginibacter antarcticus TaxID=1855725 RepID=UPI003633F94A
MKKIAAIFTLLLLTTFSYAQKTYTVSGTVKNAAGQNLQSATVFISGSEKITMTDENGRFVFRAINSGTYQLVVNMLSYTPVKQNVIVNDDAAIVNVVLTNKQTLLNEVVIGARKPEMRLTLKLL